MRRLCAKIELLILSKSNVKVCSARVSRYVSFVRSQRQDNNPPLITFTDALPMDTYAEIINRHFHTRQRYARHTHT